MPLATIANKKSCASRIKIIILHISVSIRFNFIQLATSAHFSPLYSAVTTNYYLIVLSVYTVYCGDIVHLPF